MGLLDFRFAFGGKCSLCATGVLGGQSKKVLTLLVENFTAQAVPITIPTVSSLRLTDSEGTVVDVIVTNGTASATISNVGEYKITSIGAEPVDSIISGTTTANIGYGEQLLSLTLTVGS